MVDEAQRLQNPGLTFKVIHDLFPQVSIIVTGSSSFDLKNKLSDALTGRYIDFYLPPLSIGEVLSANGVWDDLALRPSSANAILPDVLLYGLYPEIYLEGNPPSRAGFSFPGS